MSALLSSKKINQITARKLWWLYAFSATTFLFALTYPYIGEEGVYTISAIEMWSSKNFLITTLYGLPYGRPPLMNWLVIPIATLIGWSKVLLATRLIALIATILTGLMLFWLVKNLSKDKLLAIFCAVIFLSGDTLFYRGWLAYADPLFTLFIFSAIALLWVSFHAEKPYLLWSAVFLITCGALVKVQTAYIFYGIAFFTLIFSNRYRKIAFSLNSILAHFFGVALFFGWYFLITDGLQNSILYDSVKKIQTINLSFYLKQIFFFPLKTFARFLPASGVFLYLLSQKRIKFKRPTDLWPLYALAIFLINYFPYWIWPATCTRYIMPIYPFLAIAIAYYLYSFDQRGLSLTYKWLIAALILKFFFALFAFPYYQKNFRGDYDFIAQDILKKTISFPLYVKDLSATGVSITSTINASIFPKKPLITPKENWNNGFILSNFNSVALGKMVYHYKLGRNDLFLLCRGKTCRSKNHGQEQPQKSY